tara:strand:- start:928 stop:1734 length:807 start_codon:yes stop_codon:yes gene_type:complete
MLKKRIIFTLLYSKGFFYQSRNFNIQKVGDVDWLLLNYNFDNISYYIDELIILDISRKEKDRSKFLEDVNKLTKKCFIPITFGGGVTNVEIAKQYLSSGADKILINSSIYENDILINEIAKSFGQQSIIVNLDFKEMDNEYFLFMYNGSKKIEIDLNNFLKNLKDLKFGELILNSINNDGAGMGLDLNLINLIPESFTKPIIISGGTGNYKHIIDGLKNSRISAVSSSNLLNFIGNGLEITRDKLIENNLDFPNWNKELILKNKNIFI